MSSGGGTRPRAPPLVWRMTGRRVARARAVKYRSVVVERGRLRGRHRNQGVRREGLGVSGVLDHLRGVGALHAEDQRDRAPADRPRERLHAAHPLVFRESGDTARPLRPDNALRARPVDEKSLADQVVPIQVPVPCERRVQDQQRAAKRPGGCRAHSPGASGANHRGAGADRLQQIATGHGHGVPRGRSRQILSPERHAT